MTIAYLTRHFCMFYGQDFYRGPRAWCVEIGLIHRGKAIQLGECKFRLNLTIGLFIDCDGVLHPVAHLLTIPAWSDVPSVAAEHRRNLRRERAHG